MGCCDSKSEEIITQNKGGNPLCPICGQKGVKVNIETPKALLNDCCVSKIKDNVDYKWCKTPDCEISYYSSNSDHFFKTDELKVRATVKDDSLDVHVCYCFNYTRLSILNEINATGDTKALEIIKTKMKDPGCFCETSNPEGNCCLGNVTKWIKLAKSLET